MPFCTWKANSLGIAAELGDELNGPPRKCFFRTGPELYGVLASDASESDERNRQ
jgi:hypothetical protein